MTSSEIRKLIRENKLSGIISMDLIEVIERRKDREQALFVYPNEACILKKLFGMQLTFHLERGYTVMELGAYNVN